MYFAPPNSEFNSIEPFTSKDSPFTDCKLTRCFFITGGSINA